MRQSLLFASVHSMMQSLRTDGPGRNCSVNPVLAKGLLLSH